MKIDVLEDTQYVLDFTGANETAYSIELDLSKQGVKAEIYGLYNLKKDQKLKFTTVVRHLATHTSCLTQIKGVLGDGCESDYVGKILINKTGQQTTSFLNHGVLVVGEDTSNKSQPILEIDADDVKASHGATTGRLDESQMYYLMSRGLTKKEATNVIVTGFFEELCHKIEDTSVGAKLLERLVQD